MCGRSWPRRRKKSPCTLCSARRQNLRFFASLYKLAAALERRVGELLEGVGLTDRADDPVKTYSGGMQRQREHRRRAGPRPRDRLSGRADGRLDPVSCRHLEDPHGPQGARQDHPLTTHYMEEAEAISDRVAVIDHGRLIAVGTAAELIRATGVQSVVQLTVAGDATACVEQLQRLEGVREVRVSDGALQVTTASGSRQCRSFERVQRRRRGALRASRRAESRCRVRALHRPPACATDGCRREQRP